MWKSFSFSIFGLRFALARASLSSKLVELCNVYSVGELLGSMKINTIRMKIENLLVHLFMTVGAMLYLVHATVLMMFALISPFFRVFQSICSVGKFTFCNFAICRHRRPVHLLFQGIYFVSKWHKVRNKNKKYILLDLCTARVSLPVCKNLNLHYIAHGSELDGRPVGNNRCS